MSELAALAKIEMAVSVKRTIIYRVRQKTAKYNFSAKLVPTTAKNSKTRNGVNTQYEWHRKDKITRMTHIYIILNYLLQYNDQQCRQFRIQAHTSRNPSLESLPPASKVSGIYINTQWKLENYSNAC